MIQRLTAHAYIFRYIYKWMLMQRKFIRRVANHEETFSASTLDRIENETRIEATQEDKM